MHFATEEKKRLWAVRLLVQRAQELGRTPCKGDFDETTRARIKAFLGPWPKALRQAGLKEERKHTMEQELTALAKEEGFLVSLLPTEEVPVDGKFRQFCEQNICGRYGANYSCPPDCGSVETLHATLLAQPHALVIETIHPIDGYENKAAVLQAKKEHNAAVLRFMKTMREHGYEGFCTGYNGCPLCDPCLKTKGLPCAHPEQRISCMSAYCIDVAALAERCGLPFAWDPTKLHLFGLIAFHKNGET